MRMLPDDPARTPRARFELTFTAPRPAQPRPGQPGTWPSTHVTTDAPPDQAQVARVQRGSLRRPRPSSVSTAGAPIASRSVPPASRFVRSRSQPLQHRPPLDNAHPALPAGTSPALACTLRFSHPRTARLLLSAAPSPECPHLECERRLSLLHMALRQLHAFTGYPAQRFLRVLARSRNALFELACASLERVMVLRPPGLGRLVAAPTPERDG